MHQIYGSLRRILPNELPTVTPIGEKTRTMNEAELLNAGIKPVGGDLYDCLCQEQTDEDGAWKLIHPEHPGIELSRGSHKERHDALKPQDRAKIKTVHSWQGERLK